MAKIDLKIIVEKAHHLSRFFPAEFAEEVWTASNFAELYFKYVPEDREQIRARAADSVVRRLIAGNENPGIGPEFEPLLSAEEREHLFERRSAGFDSARLDYQVSIARDTAIKEGYTPFSDKELDEAYLNLQLDAYSGRAGKKRIAAELNEHYHQGNPIRTWRSVSDAIRKYQRRINKSRKMRDTLTLPAVAAQ